MQEPQDLELLQQYIDAGDERAFAQIVARHAGWICATARRMVFDPAAAEDITQAVFVLLARKARSLRRETVLSSWLFTVTRYAANTARRDAMRRARREEEAAAMRSEMTDAGDLARWQELAPMLDEVVARLGRVDRQAILLRFYEQRTFPQIGQRLEISEEAARKRVSRAVEQMRQAFARKGVTLGAAALGSALATGAAEPASAALIAGASSAALATTTAGSATIASIVTGASTMMTFASLKPIALAAAVVLIFSAAAGALMQLESGGNRAAAPPAAPAPATAPATQTIAAAPATNPANTVEVRGRVLKPDRTPLAGARVWVGTREIFADFRTIATATTNADGQYSLLALPTDQTVLIYTPGFAPLTYMLQKPPRSSGQTQITNLNRELTLTTPTTLTVHVLDPQGNPAPGVKIAAGDVTGMYAFGTGYLPDDLRNPYIQTTDASGNCVLKDLPPGIRIYLQVLDDRFAMPLQDSAIVLSREATSEGTLRLSQAGQITGTLVYTADKKPVVGLIVRADPSSVDPGARRLPQTSAHTDSAGRFALKQLQAGDYDVSVFVTDAVSATYAATSRRVVHVEAGATTANQDLALITGGTLRGKVVIEETGQPVADVTLAGLGGSNRVSGDRVLAHTRADGTYEVHVAPGDREVVLFGDLPPGLRALEPRSVEVTIVDKQATTVDFKLSNASEPGVSPGVIIRGRVVDADGKPVTGAMVTFDETRNVRLGGRNAAGPTGADGRFEMQNVDLRGTLHAQAPEMSTIAAVRVASIPNRDDVALVVHRNMQSSVLLKVVDEQNQPIANATVGMIIMSGNSGISMSNDNRQTDAQGQWLFEKLIPDREISLTATANGYGGAQVRPKLEPGKQIEVIATLKKADATVSGMVIDTDGNPAPGVFVIIQRQNAAGIPPQVQTDEQGMFKFDGIVEGESVRISSRFNGGTGSRVVQARGGDQNVQVTHDPTAVQSRRGGAPATRGGATTRGATQLRGR